MNFLYVGLYLLALAIVFPASLFNRKLRRGLSKRRGVAKRLSSIFASKPVFWFQVASSGEFEQCLPIIEELKARRDVFVLLTYFSPSAERAVAFESERRLRSASPLPWDFADYSPWDLPWVVRKVIKGIKPKAYIAIHREIWPILLTNLHAAGTRTFLFATYWPDRSKKRFRFLKSWISLFDFIGTVNEDSAKFLKTILSGVEIEVIGDSRIDRVLGRKKLATNSGLWNSFLPGNKIFVGASLWSEDFEAMTSLLSLAGQPQWRFILVPHDPAAPVAEEIYHFFKSHSLPIRYWSSWIESPDTTSHLIVNRVGLLAELYKIASIVLVGGSFKGRTHNVLEPAAYACPILTGPHVWNSNEAVEMEKQGAGLKVCKNRTELLSAYLAWTTNEEQRQKDARASLSYIKTNQGAGKKYAEVLLRGC